MNVNPADPAAPANPPGDPEELSRRRFLELLTLTLGATATTVLVVPALGFILAPLLSRNPKAWRAVGRVSDFRIGDTVPVRYEDPSAVAWAGVTAHTAAWLRRESENEFIAFSVNCSHLGCPVRWMADAKLFMCPCHGGVYYQDGSVAAGPPPKPLTRLPVRVTDSQVEILTMPLPIVLPPPK